MKSIANFEGTKTFRIIGQAPFARSAFLVHNTKRDSKSRLHEITNMAKSEMPKTNRKKKILLRSFRNLFPLQIESFESIARAADDGKDVEEDIDDVQIEIESSKNVLFWRNGILVFAAQHQLRIEDQINGEEESAE